MAAGRVIFAAVLTCVCLSMVQAQDDPLLKNRPVAGGNASTSDAIALMIPKGTAVQVVLDREVRIQKVGQAG